MFPWIGAVTNGEITQRRNWSAAARFDTLTNWGGGANRPPDRPADSILRFGDFTNVAYSTTNLCYWISRK